MKSSFSGSSFQKKCPSLAELHDFFRCDNEFKVVCATMIEVLYYEIKRKPSLKNDLIIKKPEIW